ncbi:ABC transporter permease [Facklamia sp. 7083-14-GEN3]|uniref:ABC transporter permease n=1 Tax=Facklamia sp. 7083-14-GEN3 TaxID=2973478 RepID=UPI00215D0614|nr:iron chelate uptake ABC transporter family permease subunit [Facklamia sp. 7083-14-GEN3]MCR8968428.1 iron chelate uptake ABC transporter family permease subunit [Facklamia sp. 7083-14-GEN3]
MNRSNHKKQKGLWLWSLAFIILVILSLRTGAYTGQGQAVTIDIFWLTRVPRTIALVISGMAMALSGLILQLLTQNRFVEPSTNGTTEWAGLGLMCSYGFWPNSPIFFKMCIAIVFSLGGTWLFLWVLSRLRMRSTLIVPLVGMMIGSVVSAISSYIALTLNLSQTLEVWFSASFASMQEGRYELLWLILVVIFFIYRLADRLTVTSLGKNMATNLGVDYEKILWWGSALTAVAVGIVATVVGNIPFIGLIVPNLLFLMRGDDLKSNLLWIMLMGANILLACDLLARTIVAPLEFPISIILSLIGASVFLFILIKHRRRLT